MAGEPARPIVVRGVVSRQPSPLNTGRRASGKTIGALNDDTTTVYVGGQVVTKSDTVSKSGSGDRHYDVILLKLRHGRGAKPRVV